MSKILSLSLISLMILPQASFAGAIEKFRCQGNIVGGQVTGLAELEQLEFPNFYLRLTFQGNGESVEIQGHGKQAYSQDVETGETRFLYQIRENGNRGQLAIEKDSKGAEKSISVGGLVDKISPYVFAVRCNRD